MHTKELQRIANDLLRGATRAVISSIAAIGYKGALPEGLTSDDRFELLNVLQDTAKCIDAGAMCL
jgi:hypothetical protein